MDSMPISKFKATCLATLDRVRRTGRPIRVTRFGKPMAEIIPASPDPPQKDWMGKLAHTGKIIGDLLEPSESFIEWEVNE